MSEGSQNKPYPANIVLDREKHILQIDWKDGHSSTYPLDELREACPCATCRGGHEFMGPDHDPDLLTLQPVRSYKVEDMQLSGNYALQFVWSDGHDAGIYSWEYLRRICPCPECSQK